MPVPPAIAALDHALEPLEVVRDFHGVADSDAWANAISAWRDAGVELFLEDDVPYTINNDGTLSRQVAQVLFAACGGLAAGEIHILEVGAGLGLHARYLLDEFQALCGDAGTDYYQRLRFTVTDGSINSVRAWAQAGLFSGHEAKVQLAVCDANDLAHATTLRGETLLLPPFRAILFNYILDVLPAGQFRRTRSGWEELRIRQLRRKDAGAASCSVEARFFPVAAPSRFLAHAQAAESCVVVVNESALACLEQALARLAAPGFILINDYDKREDRPGPDRFGRTLAWGLNFALLEQHFGAQGATLCRPANEENAPIYARLLMREPHDTIAAAFDAAFSEPARSPGVAALEAARLHAAQGATTLALLAFRDAVQARPRDWRLMGEAAEFLISIGSHDAARRLAEAALAINPWFSASLRNLLGDALFHMQRFEDAAAQYRAAIALNPRDARGHFNLAYIHFAAQDDAAALAALAAALAADRGGALQAQILAKQTQVLERQTASWQDQEREHMHYIHAVNAAICSAASQREPTACPT